MFATLAQSIRSLRSLVYQTIRYAYDFAFWPNRTADGFWNGLACHGCELDFFFATKLGKAQGGYIGEYMDKYYNSEMAAIMSGYLTSFLSTGRPTGATAWDGNLDLDFQSILRFSGDAKGEPIVTQSKLSEVPQCKFLERFSKSSAGNKNRATEFCEEPRRLWTSAYVDSSPAIVV